MVVCTYSAMSMVLCSQITSHDTTLLKTANIWSKHHLGRLGVLGIVCGVLCCIPTEDRSIANCLLLFFTNHRRYHNTHALSTRPFCIRICSSRQAIIYVFCVQGTTQQNKPTYVPVELVCTYVQLCWEVCNFLCHNLLPV